MKKLPALLTALIAPMLLGPALLAQTFVQDLGGNVSPLNLNLTINETIGGYRISDVQRERELARNIEYPDTIRYDAVYSPGNPASAIRNPYGWTDTNVDNYVERVTSRVVNGNTVVTAAGSNVISRTRYTNATLLEELAAAYPDRISSPRGYQLVAVRFDTPTDFEPVYDTGTHLTLVRPGLYFFAERSGEAPIFIGAEDNVYAFPQLIDFSSFETAEAGRYTDVFTGNPIEGGFDYALQADAYNGIALAEFTVYRRSAGSGAGDYYAMRAGGVFNWREVYNPRRGPAGTYDRGPIAGRNLAGPGLAFAGGAATEVNEAIITGAVTMPAARYEATLKRYLDALPPISNP